MDLNTSVMLKISSEHLLVNTQTFEKGKKKKKSPPYN